MSDINKCKELIHEIDMFFTKEIEESAVIYRKSVFTNEKEKDDHGSVKQSETKETKQTQKAVPLLFRPFMELEEEEPAIAVKALFRPFVDLDDEKLDEKAGQKSTEVTSIKKKETVETPKQTDKSLFRPFADLLDDEKLDKEPAIVEQLLTQVTSIKKKEMIETPKQTEKALPLMLIPYIGSPLAHDRRAKRRRIDFTVEDSDNEEGSNTVLLLSKRKFNAKRLRLEDTTEL